MEKDFSTGIAVGTILGVLVAGGVFYTVLTQGTDQSVQKEAVYETTHYGMGGMHGGLEHMESMQQMMVVNEREFIEMMIPHHEEAIDTATQVLKRGATTEEIETLMNNIVTAQTAEVEAMRGWYEVWFGEAYTDTLEYELMMRDLSGLSGEAIDRAFLEDMIPHHMGAIMMARSIQPYIEHEEMTILTENIVRTQSAEIVQMREMLEVF